MKDELLWFLILLVFRVPLLDDEHKIILAELLLVIEHLHHQTAIRQVVGFE